MVGVREQRDVGRVDAPKVESDRRTRTLALVIQRYDVGAVSALVDDARGVALSPDEIVAPAGIVGERGGVGVVDIAERRHELQRVVPVAAHDVHGGDAVLHVALADRDRQDVRLAQRHVVEGDGQFGRALDVADPNVEPFRRTLAVGPGGDRHHDVAVSVDAELGAACRCVPDAQLQGQNRLARFQVDDCVRRVRRHGVDPVLVGVELRRAFEPVILRVVLDVAAGVGERLQHRRIERRAVREGEEGAVYAPRVAHLDDERREDRHLLVTRGLEDERRPARTVLHPDFEGFDVEQRDGRLTGQVEGQDVAVVGAVVEPVHEGDRAIERRLEPFRVLEGEVPGALAGIAARAIANRLLGRRDGPRAVRELHDLVPDPVREPGRAVREGDRGDLVAAVRQPDALARGGHADEQVVRCVGVVAPVVVGSAQRRGTDQQLDVGREKVLENQIVVTAPMERDDRVVAVTRCEADRVRPLVAVDQVVARPTLEGVVAAVADEDVVAVRPDELGRAARVPREVDRVLAPRRSILEDDAGDGCRTVDLDGSNLDAIVRSRELDQVAVRAQRMVEDRYLVGRVAGDAERRVSTTLDHVAAVATPEVDRRLPGAGRHMIVARAGQVPTLAQGHDRVVAICRGRVGHAIDQFVERKRLVVELERVDRAVSYLRAARVVVVVVERVLDHQRVAGRPEQQDEVVRFLRREPSGHVAGREPIQDDAVRTARVRHLDDAVATEAGCEHVGVAAVIALKKLIRVGRGQCFRVVRSFDDARPVRPVSPVEGLPDLPSTPDRTVRELDSFQVRVSQAVGCVEAALEHDALAVREQHEQVAGIRLAPREADLVDPVIGQPKPRAVGPRRPVAHRVTPVAPAEHVGVDPALPVDHVIAGATFDHVVAGRTGDGVREGRASADRPRQQLVAREGLLADANRVDAVQPAIVAQRDLVVAQDAVLAETEHDLVALGIGPVDLERVRQVTAYEQRIGPARIRDRVAPVAAREDVGVVARRAAQIIVTRAAFQRASAGRADHEVDAVAHLPLNGRLEQVVRRPARAVRERDRRNHCKRLQRSDQRHRVARLRRHDHHVRAVRPRNARDRVARKQVREADRRRAHPFGKHHAIKAIAVGEGELRVSAHAHEVEALSRRDLRRAALRRVDEVLTGILASQRDAGEHVLQRQFLAVREDHALDRPLRVAPRAAEQREALPRGREPDDEIVAEGLEAQAVDRNALAEHHAIRTARVLDGCVALAVTPKVAVVAGAPFHPVDALAAGDGVVAPVEPGEALVALPARKEPIAQLVDGQRDAARELEPLDGAIAQPVHDAQHVRARAQVEQQVVAVPAHDQCIRIDCLAEQDAVDHAIAVHGLAHLVEVVARAEGVGVGRRAADQDVVALPAVQHVGLIGRAPDDVVATIAALDLQQLLDVRDQEERAVPEREPLDAVRDVTELVAHAQRVGATFHRHDEVVACLGEHHVVASDVVAELDRVVDRHVEAVAIVPRRAQLRVHDRVLPVADIELVRVAAVAADQQVIARLAVERLGEVRPRQRFGGRGADDIYVLGIEVGPAERAVAELECFDRVGLFTRAHVLVLQHDAFAGGVDGDDEVERHALEGDVRRCDALDPQRLEAAGVEDRVAALARAHDVEIVAALPLQPVVAETAVEPVGGEEAVDRVVSIGARDIDVVLEQLQPRPRCPIAEGDRLDEVGEADEREDVQKVGQRQPVVRSGDAHGERVARTLALEVEVAPTQVVREA